MKRGLINQVHNRVAQTAVGPSALRNQGGRYVVQRAREFLRRIDLSRFNVKTEAEFRRRLDKLTEALRSSLPPGVVRFPMGRPVAGSPREYFEAYDRYHAASRAPNEA
jgi:hypothetical protein